MVVAVIANLLVLHVFSFGEVLGQCGGHKSSSSGTIESPNYPKPYPAGQDCIWTVAAEGSVENIKLSFSSFDLQPRSADGECVDYVAIFRKQLKKDPGAILEAKLCGSSIPQSVQIEESSMTVQFISDSVSDSHTGFSLHYETNFKGASFSQATAGIVAAVFCAMVFIGVGVLRCIMLGACNACGGPIPRDNSHDRQVVGTSDSHTFRADFPPSYSTVMHHPERYPTTPEASPQMVIQNRGHTANGDSHAPRQNHNGRPFTLESSSSSDEDDNDPPPPPYPGIVTSEVDVDITNEDTNNTTDYEPNTASNNDGVTTYMNEEQSRAHGASLEVSSSEVGDEQSSSTAAAQEIPSHVHTAAGFSQHRDGLETSQTDAPHEEIEMVV